MVFSVSSRFFSYPLVPSRGHSAENAKKPDNTIKLVTTIKGIDGGIKIAMKNTDKTTAYVTMTDINHQFVAFYFAQNGLLLPLSLFDANWKDIK